MRPLRATLSSFSFYTSISLLYFGTYSIYSFYHLQNFCHMSYEHTCKHSFPPGIPFSSDIWVFLLSPPPIFSLRHSLPCNISARRIQRTIDTIGRLRQHSFSSTPACVWFTSWRRHFWTPQIIFFGWGSILPHFFHSTSVKSSISRKIETRERERG